MIRSRQVSTCSDWCLNITLTYDRSRISIATETPVKCKGDVSSALAMGILQSCTKPSMSLFIQPISWLWDFARFYDNTYCAIMNRIRFRCMINGKQLDIYRLLYTVSTITTPWICLCYQSVYHWPQNKIIGRAILYHLKCWFFINPL